jgi:hypothetical protein
MASALLNQSSKIVAVRKVDEDDHMAPKMGQILGPTC